MSRSLAGHHITPFPLAVRIYFNPFRNKYGTKPWQPWNKVPPGPDFGASHDGGGDGPLHGDPMARRVWKDEVSQLGIATGQWHIWRIAACLVGAAKSSKSQFQLTLRNLGSSPFTFEVFDAFRISWSAGPEKLRIAMTHHGSRRTARLSPALR